MPTIFVNILEGKTQDQKQSMWFRKKLVSLLLSIRKPMLPEAALCMTSSDLYL